MPTCMTCKGEYHRQDCICPNCGEKLGLRSVTFCHKCRAEIGGQRLCPRCKSDVSAWEQEKLSLLQFTAQGGWLGLVPLAVLAALWLAYWTGPEKAIHHPIASVLSLMVSVLIFYTMYSRRYRLRERGWAAEVYRVRGPALSNVGIAALAVGGVGMMVIVILSKTLPSPQFPEKMLFALVYTLTYGGFTTGLTLLALGNYIARLNERMPQPVFVHTDRLFDIVLKTAAKSIRDRGGLGEDRETLGDFEIVEVVRNQSDGGILGLVMEHKLVRPIDDPYEEKSVEMKWVIDADKWGRIRSIKPGYMNAGAGLSSRSSTALSRSSVATDLAIT
jgi:hypothetical protein